MKHRRLMILAILFTLVGSIFADNLTVPSVELKAGKAKDVAINLNSSERKYVAFQFDVVLPEGVSIAKKDNGKLAISLNADRIDDHTLTVQDLGSGSYRLLCFSMTNAELYGTSGALVNMALQADENASDGTKQGQIKSQVFTEINGNQVKWDDLLFNITIASSGSSTEASSLTVSEIELKTGNLQEATINLNNASRKYVAFQFDVVLPEGVSIAKKDNGKLAISLNADRIDDHTLTVQDLGSGSYRLLCFSMTNAEFYGTSGALVNMTLQTDENASDGTKQGQIKSQVFTETNGNQVKWDDLSFNISIASSSGSSTEASSLTVSEIELKTGNLQEATINLNNASRKYVAFQFDVVLPEGVSIAKKDNGKLAISLNADRIDDHTLTVQDLGSGSYRLLCFSMTNAELYGTSGALVNMSLQADKSASVGTKEGVIKSQVFTDTNGKQVKWNDVLFNISIADAVIPEITADNKSRNYGDDNPELTYTTTATLTGVPQLTTTATKISPVGEYNIVVERGTVQGDYTSKNGKLTITKAPLTITAKSYTIKQGDALPTFEVEYSGFKNNETDAVLTKKPTLSTTATSASAPGTYDIVVSGADATNYDISYVKGTLTISAVELEPVKETETKAFSETINENTDLSNTIIDNTYFTVNAENGDGYDVSEQAIVLNTTTTTEQINAVQNAKVGDTTMQENFKGIIFEVSAGNGTITVEVKTIGSHVLNVQIGNAEPTMITKSERGTADVPYNVTTPTYVYLYASTSGASSAPKSVAAANSVLLYSYKVTVTVNGIQSVTYNDLENAKWYTTDGLQLQGKPTKKGLYIVNGHKVIVK